MRARARVCIHAYVYVLQANYVGALEYGAYSRARKYTKVCVTAR